ncbi:hypothetical protein GIW70_20855 [Pseudomonas syringae]|nr:hypothetical protein [Pseudomonas syringae]MCF5070636.1 hypothetical protein [Pseudomonas syringae]
METQYFWIAAAVVVLLLDLWALNSVWRSDRSSGAKGMWTVILLVFPLLGLAIWGFAGPRGVVKGPSSAEHSKG